MIRLRAKAPIGNAGGQTVDSLADPAKVEILSTKYAAFSNVFFFHPAHAPEFAARVFLRVFVFHPYSLTLFLISEEVYWMGKPLTGRYPTKAGDGFTD